MAIPEDRKCNSKESNDDCDSESEKCERDSGDESREVQAPQTSGSPRSSSTSESTRKRKEPAKLTGDKDIFCWQCHRDGSLIIQCQICPRIYHRRCAKLDAVPATPWTCIECTSKMTAESFHTRSEAMKSLTQDQLNKLLRFVMERIHSHEGSEHFREAVDIKEYPNYRDFIINPMDLATIEKNISNGKYQSTETFLADLKWLVHNSYIFNSVYSEFTSYARGIVKIAKQETEEIENCPNCYYHAHTMDEDAWFMEPCKKPHLLIWAKLRGFPHWPGKVMKVVDDMVDVRFFGDHNKAWVTSDCCYLFSRSPPGCYSKQRMHDTSGFDLCLKEVQEHVEKLKQKYGKFSYAQFRMKYTPLLHEEHLAEMLPSFKKFSGSKSEKMNGCVKRSAGVNDNVIAEKKKKVEDCLNRIQMSRNASLEAKESAAEEGESNDVVHIKEEEDVKIEEPDITLEVVKQSAESRHVDSRVNYLSSLEDSVEMVTDSDTDELTIDTDPNPATRPDSDNPVVVSDSERSLDDEKGSSSQFRLKVKSSEQLLSSAALKMHKSAANETNLDNCINLDEPDNHVDEIIDKVCKGNITITLPSRKMPLRQSTPPRSNQAQISTNSLLKPSKFHKEPVSNKLWELGKNIIIEDIADIGAWSLEPFNEAPSIKEALDSSIKSIDEVKDFEESKNLLQQLKKLVLLQRQEMKEMYCKMRQEAQELCDVLSIEQEKIEETKDALDKKIKKIKLTQWCALCLKEANFYCCWGTSYCSPLCQKNDWPTHFEHCKQVASTPGSPEPDEVRLPPMKAPQKEASLQKEGSPLSIRLPTPSKTKSFLVPKIVNTSTSSSPFITIAPRPVVKIVSSQNDSSTSPAAKVIDKGKLVLSKALSTKSTLVPANRNMMGTYAGVGQYAGGSNQSSAAGTAKVVSQQSINQYHGPKGNLQKGIYLSKVLPPSTQMSNVTNKVFVLRRDSKSPSSASPVRLNNIAQPLKVLPVRSDPIPQPL